MAYPYVLNLVGTSILIYNCEYRTAVARPQVSLITACARHGAGQRGRQEEEEATAAAPEGEGEGRCSQGKGGGVDRER